MSVLVLGEIWQGIAALVSRDAAQSQALTHWYGRLKIAFAGRILGLSEATVERWGELNSRRSLSVVDGILAATALVHDLVLITRNVKDIAGTDVRFVNPFESKRVRVAT